MKLIFQDAVSTRNAFDEFIKIEDDPDVGLVIRNEILDEIDGISKMILTVEDRYIRKIITIWKNTCS